MSNNGRGARFWIRAWWPVALSAVVIAFESTAWFGADRTSGPLRAIWQALFGSVSTAQWGILGHLIRKAGHFLGYGIIGLVWLRAWRLTLPRLQILPGALLAVLGTALIASCDEFHQSFIPSRTGSPWDVLLDCSGAAAMCLAAWGIARLTRARQAGQLSAG